MFKTVFVTVDALTALTMVGLYVRYTLRLTRDAKRVQDLTELLAPYTARTLRQRAWQGSGFGMLPVELTR